MNNGWWIQGKTTIAQYSCGFSGKNASKTASNLRTLHMKARG
jgi:hypothetical protein